MPRASIDLTGQPFGRWTVIARAPHRAGSHTRWLCRCACGALRSIDSASLQRGETHSCGCWRQEWAAAQQRTHGMHGSPEYRVWTDMRRRCYDPNNARYDAYGGRGITVCEAWRDSFAQFYADMGPRPSLKHSIDRINNDLSYSPDNCRWALPSQQNRNSRNTHLITLGGETRCLIDWIEHLSLSKAVYWNRIRDGWSPEQALTTPSSPAKRPITIDGVTMHLAAWLRLKQMGMSTYCQRIRAGLSQQEAITTPIRTHHRKPK